MADTMTSAETDAAVLTGTELVRLVQSAVNKKVAAELLGHQFRGARVRMSADDTAQNVTTETAITFDVADFDTDSFWSGGAPTRLTIPASQGIEYVQLSGQIFVSGSTADTTSSCFIYQYNSSNTVLRAIGMRFTESGSTARSLVAHTGPLDVSDGDYFQLMITQETDTSITIEGDSTIQTFLSLTVLGMVP
jgi:hypothetical protein